jgi:hypothetical protein
MIKGFPQEKSKAQVVWVDSRHALRRIFREHPEVQFPHLLWNPSLPNGPLHF